ncbi:MAG: flagellar protein [Syntrophomonadaceae bacterium]|jgi:flagellar operon protein|nr:flagellar protein [Syntrophomonadaceae bacterium]
MTSRIFFPQPIKPTAGANPSQPTSDPGKFDAILSEKLRAGDVKFSQHARQRIKSRNIELTEGDLQKLQSAVDKAGAKGARESLILIDRLALVVSVKNRTVITAVDEANLKENVFTNIDSAVIM